MKAAATELPLSCNVNLPAPPPQHSKLGGIGPDYPATTYRVTFYLFTMDGWPVLISGGQVDAAQPYPLRADP